MQAHKQTAISMAHKQTAISMALHSPKVWEQFDDDIYSVPKTNPVGKLFALYQQSLSKH